MLQKLAQVAQEGTIRISHVYLGHIKKDEDRKILAHAEVRSWEDAEPNVRSLLEQHLYQMIGGTVGEVNFPCMYTGEILSVAKVASADFDRTRNRPVVEILEALRDMRDAQEDAVIELGNSLCYKVMAAGAINNHLVAMLKFETAPQLGAQPVSFIFATICDLDDREESLFDEMKGKFATHLLNNVVKRGSVSRAVLFPCLDDDGREQADMLVHASNGAGAWFKALEATRRFSPRKEGQALVRMIAEQSVGGEAPHDLFSKMGEELLHEATDGLNAQSVVVSLEKALGHGVDRLGFQARWESAFGDLGYRPNHSSLFRTADVEKPVKLKLQAGDVQISIRPEQLGEFRQVTVGDQTFIVFAVPERAKVTVGKDLDLRIQPVDPGELLSWIGSGGRLTTGA